MFRVILCRKMNAQPGLKQTHSQKYLAEGAVAYSEVGGSITPYLTPLGFYVLLAIRYTPSGQYWVFYITFSIYIYILYSI